MAMDLDDEELMNSEAPPMADQEDTEVFIVNKFNNQVKSSQPLLIKLASIQAS